MFGSIISSELPQYPANAAAAGAVVVAGEAAAEGVEEAPDGPR
jgi:hypothetical protein